jgi:hypothetical protein
MQLLTAVLSLSALGSWIVTHQELDYYYRYTAKPKRKDAGERAGLAHAAAMEWRHAKIENGGWEYGFPDDVRYF